MTGRAVAGMVAAVILGGCGLAACGGPDPCQVNPTRQAADGHWVEADGEELDSDPCDSDDLDGGNHRKPKKPTQKKR